MSRRLVLLRKAEVDIDETVSRYEGDRVGFGVRFLQDLNVLLETVEENPFQFPVVHEKTRRGLLSRFPYGVFFTVNDEEILIVSVVHLHRHPDTWNVGSDVARDNRIAMRSRRTAPRFRKTMRQMIANAEPSSTFQPRRRSTHC